MKYEAFELEKKGIMEAARAMADAARTAPKARGLDKIEFCLLDGEEKSALTAKMREIAEAKGLQFFVRDADCVDAAQAIFLIGVRKAPCGISGCGLCGAATCEENPAPCTFNITDLGIAVGSAVSVAMDRRIDNRVLYSAGLAAAEMQLLGTDVEVIYGIPLSVSGKSIFFDR